MATELDFCVHLLKKFLKFWETNKTPYLEIFLDPVDEVDDNAPGYYTTITSPIDLATMATKLNNGAYSDAQAFKKDFDLMIKNCHDYNGGNPDFIKKYADRFVKEFEWEWSEMGRWMSTTRRKLARDAAVAAAASASAPSTATATPTTSTSGDEIPASPRSSASDAEPESSSRPSPSPSLGSPQGNGMATPRPSACTNASTLKRRRRHAEEDVDDEETPKRVRVNDSSEDAVGRAVRALREVMVQWMDIVAGEKMATMEAQGGGVWTLWEKIWGPERRQTSTEMWRAKCFSKITRAGWPTSPAAIKAEVEQAWSETSSEQIELMDQEEAAEAAAAAIRKAAERAAFLRQLE
ncbi:hypothetical protein KCU65_g5860, partial [Aureobasidium melanogenum]